MQRVGEEVIGCYITVCVESVHCVVSYLFFFFFNDTATTEIYTLSLHDALPIWLKGSAVKGVRALILISSGRTAFRV